MEKAWTKSLDKSLDTHLQSLDTHLPKSLDTHLPKAWTPICSRKPQKKSLLKKSLAEEKPEENEEKLEMK